jgi:two-component system NtrC family sensor kinase
MAMTQSGTTAELQRTIAELRRERDAALARRNAEYSERTEHQAATIDVLRAMSASPGDPQPVFNLIVHHARELCGGFAAGLLEYDGQQVHFRSHSGGTTSAEVAEYSGLFPMTPTSESIPCRAILERKVIHIRDMAVEPGLHPVVQHLALRFRSNVAVPLMRDSTPIGAIFLNAVATGGFSDSQIELLQTFAEQAVIAIGSAETYRALQERTAALAERNSEYSERIAHQSATIDVLKEMSASPGDPRPVFDQIVRRAQGLCNSTNAVLFEYDGEMVHCRAMTSSASSRDELDAYMARFPMPLQRDPNHIHNAAILEGRIVHVRDTTVEEGVSPAAQALGVQSGIAIPLIRDDAAVGCIVLANYETGGYSDTQIELLKTFAEQAVIAMRGAETFRALQTRTSDLQVSLEYQTATSDVLQVISRSTFDLQPVLDTVAATAARLCDAEQAAIGRREGDKWGMAANFGFPFEYEAYYKERGLVSFAPDTVSAGARVAREGRIVHIDDAAAVPGYPEVLLRLGKHRTILGVPLLREGEAIGTILLARQRVEPFTNRQIELVSTFADQAVIAIENTRLINEQQEALEQQTAIADVLRAINATPGELAPVFDVIGEKAIKLCDAAAGALMLPDGDRFKAVALGGVPEAYAEFCRNSPAYGRLHPGSLQARMLAGEDVVHIKDITDVDEYAPANTPSARALAELGGGRTLLGVALRKDDKFFGMITIFRQAVRPFSDRQVVLLQSFADQAVIAMENARLLEEVRQRQEELRITFENMGDGVAMFDEMQHLVAWNRKFQDIVDVPDDILARRQTFSEYVRYLAGRGEYGADTDVEAQVRRLLETAAQMRVFERVRPNGRVIEVRSNPVAGGGFVLIYADITERKRNEAEIRAARDAAEGTSRTIEAAYRDLKAAQANLIQAEKMASLGQLTAGIAHEIKNPLNFVNNFAALSVELIDELQEALALEPLGETVRTEVEDLTALLKGNLEKVVQHGQRADGIVKSMLEHSRGSSGERRVVD